MVGSLTRKRKTAPEDDYSESEVSDYASPRHPTPSDVRRSKRNASRQASAEIRASADVDDLVNGEDEDGRKHLGTADSKGPILTAYSFA